MDFVFTLDHKLEAIAARFYQDVQWTPKVWDYYTICRHDLELFQIVYEDRNEFRFNKVYPTKYEFTDKWVKKGFTTEGFGPRRVWIPPYVLTRMRLDFIKLQKGKT